MSDVVRTYLARYESRLLAEAGRARSEFRAAARRIQELETEIAGVRDALAIRAREPEAVSPHKEKRSSGA